MRVRTRYLLAVTLVATTLCVDRVVASDQRADPTPSRGLVDRLTDGFRRTVATRPIVRQRCPRAVATDAASPALVVRTTAVVPRPACPSHLPQPPPAV